MIAFVLMVVVGAVLGTAWADTPIQAPTDLVGLPVAGVSLVAGDGGLPDNNLEPLLRSVQGQPYDPQTVRQDITLLYRTSDFSAIQADVQPWVMVGDTGEPEPAVLLTYEVYMAPRIKKRRIFGSNPIQVVGNRGLSARQIKRASGVHAGAVFYPALDAPRVQERVYNLLASKGYPEAQVTVEPELVAPRVYEVTIRVDAGMSHRLASVQFSGLPDTVPTRKARRWARKAGIRKGKPVDEQAMNRARFRIREQLSELPRTQRADPGNPKPGGWVEVRVGATLREPQNGQLVVEYTIDPGPQLLLRNQGIRTREVRKALSTDQRLRLTRGFVEQASDRIVEYLRRKGYRRAKAEVSQASSDTVRQLIVNAQRGPRTRIGRIAFEGNTAASSAALKRVLRKSFPQTVGRHRMVDDDLRDIERVIASAYQALGYPSADITLTITTLNTLLRRRIRLDVHIEEGPVSLLAKLNIHGMVDAVGETLVTETQQAIVGEPFSPSAVRLVAAKLAILYRGKGYLDATAVPEFQQDEPGKITATIELDSGPQVLLRSFSTKGNQRVSSKRIQRTAGLRIGKPLTSVNLNNARYRLYELGVFSAVSFELLGDGAERDLVAVVRERPRHSLELGFGLSTDQGIRFSARYTLRNLFFSADRLELFGLIGIGLNYRGPVAWLPGLNLPEYSLAATYTVPIGMTELSLEALVREVIQERYWRMVRSGGGFRWELGPGRRDRLSFRMRIEMRKLADADPGTLLANEVWSQEDVTQRQNTSTSTRFRPVDSVSALYVHDGRNDPLNPTRGALFSVLAEFSPSLPYTQIGRNHRVPFVRGDFKTQGFVPLGPLTLRLLGEVGHARVVGLGNLPSYPVDQDDPTSTTYPPAIPADDRYFLGGTASVRGFRRDAIGPHQRVSRLSIGWPNGIDPAADYGTQAEDQRWVPTGGDTFARGSIELQIPFTVFGLSTWEKWSLATFADVGNVWILNPGPTVTSNTEATKAIFNPLLRYGVGTGLRIITPVGPLQTDLAFNPEAAFTSEGSKKYQLLREGWNEPWWRFHLTLGTLF